MNKKIYLNKHRAQLILYKINVLYIEKLLNEYVSEEKSYLFAASKRLNEKLKNLEAMIEKLKSCDEEIQTELQRYTTKYFERIKEEFREFLMLLKWRHFSSINIKNYKQYVKESPQPSFLKRRIIGKNAKKQLVSSLKPNIETIGEYSFKEITYETSKETLDRKCVNKNK